MKITALCIGSAETLPGKKYRTGILKTTISGPVPVDEAGLLGDRVCNRKHHGGPDQAVYIEGGLTLDWWADQLGKPLAPGTFGENLVISGLDNRDIAVGDRFVIGDVTLEATAARVPCATFAARMGDPMFVKRYAKAARPGIYCRVLATGMLETGQSVLYEPYRGERITMPEMLACFGRKLEGADRARFLSVPLAIRLHSFLTQ